VPTLRQLNGPSLDQHDGPPAGAAGGGDIRTLPAPRWWAEQAQALLQACQEAAGAMLGFPESQAYPTHPIMAEFLGVALNTLGEPGDQRMRYGVNAAAVEQRVVEWFANLYDLPADQAWGYVTGSGSEGNTWGLLLGREACGGVQARPVLYSSSAAHYSVAKAALVLGVPHCVVRQQSTGEMDYDSLAAALQENADRPAIILATAGTTMTEAIDDVWAIDAICRKVGVPHHYVHLDAALCGLTLPWHPSPDAPRLTFDGPIQSISVSIHKFWGSPQPCGIALARRPHVERIREAVEYVGSGNGTLFGSRAGFAAVHTWLCIATCEPHMPGLVRQCVDNAAYLTRRMRAVGIDAWRNPHALTVVFPEPGPELLRKHQLPAAEGAAHVITVPSVSWENLDAFVDRLAEDFDPALTSRGPLLTASPA
jgi:histidine decarboxylase